MFPVTFGPLFLWFDSARFHLVIFLNMTPPFVPGHSKIRLVLPSVTCLMLGFPGAGEAGPAAFVNKSVYFSKEYS